MRRNTAVAYCALLGLNQTIMIPIAPASMRPGQLAPEMSPLWKPDLAWLCEGECERSGLAGRFWPGWPRTQTYFAKNFQIFKELLCASALLGAGAALERSRRAAAGGGGRRFGRQGGIVKESAGQRKKEECFPLNGRNPSSFVCQREMHWAGGAQRLLSEALLTDGLAGDCAWGFLCVRCDFLADWDVIPTKAAPRMANYLICQSAHGFPRSRE